MKKIKFALAVFALNVGIASAAWPNWVSGIPSVKIGPNITGSTSPYAEGTPVLMVTISGVQYVYPYNNDRAKSFFEMAKQASASGKSLSIYSDVDNKMNVTSCGDYTSAGCVSKNTTTGYNLISEISF